MSSTTPTIEDYISQDCTPVRRGEELCIDISGPRIPQEIVNKALERKEIARFEYQRNVNTIVIPNDCSILCQIQQREIEKLKKFIKDQQEANDLLQKINEEHLLIEQQLQEKADGLQKFINFRIPQFIVETILRGENYNKIGQSVVLFADIAKFSTWSRDKTTQHMDRVVNGFLEAAHETSSKHQALTIKTVGDCYIATTGIDPGENQQDKVDRMLTFSIDVLETAKASFAKEGELSLEVRIGIHVGEVCARLLFGGLDILGEAVNRAARVESGGEANQILVSKQIKEQSIHGEVPGVFYGAKKIYANGYPDGIEVFFLNQQLYKESCMKT